MEKKEIISVLEEVFENTKRIHGNSESIDWIKLAIHKSASFLADELEQQPAKADSDKRKRAEQCILDYTASTNWDGIKNMSWTTAEIIEVMIEFSQQSEVSDEEIEKWLNKYYMTKINTDEETKAFTKSVLKFAKWMREQMKSQH